MASIGLFATLAEPTKPMTVEATKAGYYESPVSKSFPKVQLLTIQDLLEKKAAAEYPDLARGGLTFKKAKSDEGTADQHDMFSRTHGGFAEDRIVAEQPPPTGKRRSTKGT